MTMTASECWWERQYDWLKAENAKLKAENAKLRALLIDAYAEFVVPYGDADDVHEYADRMCELGIEAV